MMRSPSQTRPAPGMLVGVLMVLMASTSVGQSAEKSIGDLVHELADKEANRYQITAGEQSIALTRVPRSVLRWSNATRNEVFGDTYIWTDRGCARAIISIFAIVRPQQSIAAECQSLSETSLTMRRDGNVLWSTRQPGVEFKPVPGIRPPADSPTSRLVQMNSIARRFQAEFAPHTKPDEFSRLRLLSKPLFRYDSTNEDVVDGAVYGFVDATDPEALLVVEARRNGGQTSWFYAPARSRHDHIRVYWNGEVVWEGPRLAPPWPNMRDPSKPYFNVRLEQFVPADDWRAISEFSR